MLKTILYRLVIWLLVCITSTTAFAFIHQTPFSSTDLFSAIYNGLKLDITFFGYILLMTLLFRWHPFLFKISKWIFGLLLFFQVVVCVIDVNLYSSWQHTINYQFFEYIKYPATALGNASASQIGFGTLGIILGLIFSYFLGIKKHPHYTKPAFRKWHTYALTLVYLALGVILSRGGIQVAPANISSAFFSSKMPLNYAAINNSWNFIFTALNGQDDANLASFQYFKDAETKFNEAFIDSSQAPKLINDEQPNIVIILLESFTANLSKSCGANEDFTPNFNNIAKENILFSNAYASGNRTDKGLAAVVSGFPAQATASIITIPSKTQNLPSIFKVLKKQGYESNFYYGGEPEFANMKAYLLNSGIDKMNAGSDYPKNIPRGKWGAHDEFMFKELANDILKAKKPFCKMLLTLSSHEPFDYPNSNANTNKAAICFRNSISYTDSCLGAFWQKVKNTPNTVFIFMADHGRNIEVPRADQIPMVNRMPILIAGSAINPQWKAKSWQHAINQHHFPSNLLNICGINNRAEPFQFQGNWFNPKQWAYFTYYNGAGITNGTQWCQFNNDQQKGYVNSKTQDSSLLINLSKLYQQRVMEEFTKR